MGCYTHTHTHTHINNLFVTSNHEFINWNNMCHDRKKSITMISKAKNCFWNNNTPLKVILKEFQTFIQHFKFAVSFFWSHEQVKTHFFIFFYKKDNFWNFLLLRNEIRMEDCATCSRRAISCRQMHWLDSAFFGEICWHDDFWLQFCSICSIHLFFLQVIHWMYWN